MLRIPDCLKWICITQWRMQDLVEGEGGGGGAYCRKQGRSRCSRHEMANGGWVREGVFQIRKCLDDF